MHAHRLEISSQQILDLRSRLELTRWPATIDRDGSDRGLDTETLQRLARKWMSLDWDQLMQRINSVPGYITEIDGAPIHFQHIRSPHQNATPLLLTHGWPSSVAEFSKIVPMLTHPEEFGGSPDDAFHLVIPSLPGFTLSTPMSATGWDVPQIAGAWAQLMSQLGYDSYLAQGGDAGSPISLALGLVDPEHVRGIHVNMLLTFPDPDEDLSPLTDLDHDRLAQLGKFNTFDAGYMQIMQTRPQTLAFGLSDSPVGCLAWIAEKFIEWADPKSWEQGRITDEDILATASLYWFTNSHATAANFYFEGAPGMRALAQGQRPPASGVPTSVAVFAHDPFLPVPSLAAKQNPDIVQWSDFDEGGHFPSLEVPDLLCGDLRSFNRTLQQQLIAA